MIRLRRDDFQNPEKLARLAKTANLTPEEFRREFESVVADEPPPLAIDDHGEAAHAGREPRSNPKLQIPSSNHSQIPTPNSRPLLAAIERWDLGVGAFVGIWPLGVVGIWDLELGI